MAPVLGFGLYAGLAARQSFPAEDPVIEPEQLQAPSANDSQPEATEGESE